MDEVLGHANAEYAVAAFEKRARTERRASCTSRCTLHDSGSGWFTTPFLYDSFIRFSMLVFTSRTRRPDLMKRFEDGLRPGAISFGTGLGGFRSVRNRKTAP